MNITVIGTGYVGLVSGACFAEFGFNVTCVDKDAGKITRLKAGEIPIYEPGLDELVAKNVKQGRLSFTTDLAPSVAAADTVFIAVGTPTPENGVPDLSYCRAAATDIAPHLTGYTVVVNKSTVPVGFGREIQALIKKTNPAADFDVASNPEFLREGSAIGDFMRPDRVVIGAETERAQAVMRALYRPLFLIETPIVMTSLETAELIKYAANAFLATKISFINEIANLCEQVGADVQQVAKGIGLDGRIGRKFLHAGPGFGGSCFPKDTRALAHIGRAAKAPQTIVETVVRVNEARKLDMAARVKKAVGDVKGKTIAVLGVTFKPNTDDMREAVSLVVIPELQKAGAAIRAFDPAGMDEAAKLLSHVTWAKDAYDALSGADAAVILTEWNEFRALDLDVVKAKLKAPVFVDLRNIYKPQEMKAAGFIYSSVGR